MSETPDADLRGEEPAWLARLAGRRPDFVLIAPYMAFLAVMAAQSHVPEAYLPWAIAAKGLAGVWVFWILRRHMPPLGRPYWGLAILVGVLVAAGWAAGDWAFREIGWGGKLFIMSGDRVADDPREGLSALSWWSQVIVRITVATIAVPIVEELFWRAFLLRSLIDWQRFESIPLGTFAWRSFIGTALLSTLQHPEQWGISILCWLAFNALFVWKKSLLFLMIIHGVTNLALYIYVVAYEDWWHW